MTHARFVIRIFGVAVVFALQIAGSAAADVTTAPRITYSEIVQAAIQTTTDGLLLLQDAPLPPGASADAVQYDPTQISGLDQADPTTGYAPPALEDAEASEYMDENSARAQAQAAAKSTSAGGNWGLLPPEDAQTLLGHSDPLRSAPAYVNYLPTLSNAVNLYTGQHTETFPLISAPVAGGLSISLALGYNGNVAGVARAQNHESQASCFGLGFGLNSGLQAIVSDHHGTPYLWDDDYYLLSNDTATALLRIGTGNQYKPKSGAQWAVTRQTSVLNGYDVIVGWTIKTETGTVYGFGDFDIDFSTRNATWIVQRYNDYVGYGVTNDDQPYPIRWDLATVRDAENLNSLSYTYEQDVTHTRVAGTSGVVNSTYPYTRASYLTNITASDGTIVEFSLSDRLDRQTLYGVNIYEFVASKKVDEVRLKRNGAFASRVHFDYTYLSSDRDSTYNKLALASITFLSGDNTMSAPPVTFDYYTSRSAISYGSIYKIHYSTGAVKEVKYTGVASTDNATRLDTVMQPLFTEGSLAENLAYVMDLHDNTDPVPKLAYWDGYWTTADWNPISRPVVSPEGWAAAWDVSAGGQLVVKRWMGGYWQTDIPALQPYVSSSNGKDDVVYVHAGPESFMVVVHAFWMSEEHPDPNINDIVEYWHTRKLYYYRWNGSEWLGHEVFGYDLSGGHYMVDDIQLSDNAFAFSTRYDVPNNPFNWGEVVVGKYMEETNTVYMRTLEVPLDGVNTLGGHFTLSTDVITIAFGKGLSDLIDPPSVVWVRWDDNAHTWEADAQTFPLDYNRNGLSPTHTFSMPDGIGWVANDFSDLPNRSYFAVKFFDNSSDGFIDNSVGYIYPLETYPTKNLVQSLYASDHYLTVKFLDNYDGDGDYHPADKLDIFEWNGNQFARIPLFGWYSPTALTMEPFQFPEYLGHGWGEYSYPNLCAEWARVLFNWNYLGNFVWAYHYLSNINGSNYPFRFQRQFKAGKKYSVFLDDHQGYDWDSLWVFQHRDPFYYYENPEVLQYNWWATLGYARPGHGGDPCNSPVMWLDGNTFALPAPGWTPAVGLHKVVDFKVNPSATGWGNHQVPLIVVNEVKLYTHATDPNPRIVGYSYFGGLVYPDSRTPRFAAARESKPHFNSETAVTWVFHQFYNDIDSMQFHDPSIYNVGLYFPDLNGSVQRYGVYRGGWLLDGMEYLTYSATVDGGSTTWWPDTTRTFHSLAPTPDNLADVYFRQVDSVRFMTDGVGLSEQYQYDASNNRRSSTRAQVDFEHWRVDSLTFAHRLQADMTNDNMLVSVGTSATYIESQGGLEPVKYSTTTYAKHGSWKPISNTLFLEAGASDPMPSANFTATAHDSKGNITEWENALGIPRSFIYGADGKSVVADIHDGRRSDCIYQDFENGETWDGWLAYDEFYRIYDSEDPFTGKYSFKLLDNHNPNDRSWGASYDMPGSALTDTLYHFSVWAKFNHPIHVYALVYKSPTEYTTGGYLPVYFGTVSPDDWTLLEGTWNFAQAYNHASETIHHIRFQLTMTDTDDPSHFAKFDDFRVHPVKALMSTTVYDQVTGRVVAESGHNNIPIKYRYDKLGRIIEVRDYADRIISTNDYSLRGSGYTADNPNWVKSTIYRSDDDSTESVSFYDGLWLEVQTRTVSTGWGTTVAAREYDAQGRIVKSYKPYYDSQSGNTIFTYDNATLLPEVRAYYDSDGPGADCLGYPYVEYRYETKPTGRVSEIEFPGEFRGHPITKDYERTGAVLPGFDPSYYSAGQVFLNRTTDEDGNSTVTFTDKFGQTIGHVRDSSTGGIAAFTRYYRDILGRDTLIEQPEGQMQRRAYNSRGWLLRDSTGDYGLVENHYDDLGRLRFKQSATDRAASRFHYYKYDRHDRVVEEGVLEDAPGMLNRQNANDPDFPAAAALPGVDLRVLVESFYAHSGYGRGLLDSAVTYPSGKPDSASWNALEYDPYGRLLQNSQFIYEVDDSLPRTYFATYNRQGQTASLTYPNFCSAIYGYNKAGQACAVTARNKVAEIAQVEQSFTPSGMIQYETSGRIGQTGLIAQTLDHKYNARDWLVSINDGSVSPDVSGNTTHYALTLSYTTGGHRGACDPYGNCEYPDGYYNGNVASYDIRVSPGTYQYAFARHFAYDGMNRLAVEEYDNYNPPPTESYEYDRNGNITAIYQDDVLRYSYSYYPNTNRVEQVAGLYPGAGNISYTPSGSVTGISSTSMNMLYNYFEEMSYRSRLQTYGTNKVYYWYNSNGERIAKKYRYYYRYICDPDVEQQLINRDMSWCPDRLESTEDSCMSKVLPAHKEAFLGALALLRHGPPKKLLKWVPSMMYATDQPVGTYCTGWATAMTGYYRFAGDVLSVYTGPAVSDLVANYLYLNGRRVAEFRTVSDGVGARYYMHDHVGSIVATCTGGGDLRNWYQYKAFGSLYQRHVRDAQRYEFVEKELEGELGFQWNYFGARYYDPLLGRFLAADPQASLTPGWSAYVYSSNNPIGRFDPDGMKDKPFNSATDDAIDWAATCSDETATPAFVRNSQGRTVGLASGAENAYNCHSWAWNNGNGDPSDPPDDINRSLSAAGVTKWDNDPADDIEEQGYQQLGVDEPNQVGDRVIYYIDENDNGQYDKGEDIAHSAVVSQVDEEGNTECVMAKTGECGIAENHPRSPEYYDQAQSTKDGRDYPTKRAYFRKEESKDTEDDSKAAKDEMEEEQEEQDDEDDFFWF